MRSWKQINYLTILFALRQMKSSGPLKPMMSSLLFAMLTLKKADCNGQNRPFSGQLSDAPKKYL